MATDQEDLNILKQGAEAWNKWREAHNYLDGGPYIKGADFYGANFCNADFSEGDLSETNFKKAILHDVELWGANLSDADFSKADLEGSALGGANLTNTNFSIANLRSTDFRSYSHDIHTGPNIKEFMHRTDLINTNFQGSDLSGADLSGMDLTKANLRNALLIGADLSNANLSNINLSDVDLRGANLTRANLTGTRFTRALLNGADLSGTYICGTDFNKANLTGCRIYGVAVWDVGLEDTIQEDLIITPDDSPKLTVDNLEVAQFIYLLLKNQKIREVINTITSKVVLILGRFTTERKVVLNALRDELRDRNNYLPVVFDFEKPTTRDLTETVNTLAHLARFIIIDLTDPSSAPHEAATIIPQCVVPVQPLLIQDDSRHEYAMFQDLRRRYHWVLPTYHYQDIPSLLASLKRHIIDPAELKAQELERRM